MLSERIVIGTRGSTLALWQAQYVAERLRTAKPQLEVHLKTIQTRGDLVRDRALAQVGGKGLFAKEIQHALSSGEIDLAVHSLKDMPTEQPNGLVLGAMFCTYFAKDPVTDYASAKTSDAAAFGRFFQAMLQAGIYLAPSQFEAGFTSTAHTDEVIGATIGAAQTAFRLA